MNVLQVLILINYCLCLVCVLDMIFVGKKKPEKIIAWMLLMIVPFVGLFIYILIGAGLSHFVKRIIKKLELSSEQYSKHIKDQIKMLKDSDEQKTYPEQYKDLILLNLNNNDSVFSKNNDVKFYLDGKSVVKDLLEDIKNAKSTINMEFYIFANDKVGKTVINALTEKAQQGVEVRVCYDAIGSIHTSKYNFRKLKKAGGKITVFFPPFLNIKVLNFKANYRNHRKICVIDGKIGYTGGFNLRDDHMGDVKRLAPWRDTSVRIVGGAVHSLQNIFLSDWRFAVKDTSKPEIYLNEKFFPSIKKQKNVSGVPMQVISSGPTTKNEQIKTCIIKMINSAKKSVKIQTPYFIPDDAFVGAIKLALLSGIEVSLMVPKKIDHWYVHYGSISHINDLLKYGLKVYVYDGFIHSKVVLVDDEILTLGSCNIDVRSFSLNFEDNVVIYDAKKALEYSQYFSDDLKMCTQYTEQTRKNTNIFAKIVISFCRLFSCLL